MNVTLYSTGCPRCTIIEKKLRTEGIDFTLVSGEDAKQEMLKMGFTMAPVLVVDDSIMDFVDANNWIKVYKFAH